jgi:hypothetical protein
MDYETKLNLLNITQLKTLIRKYSLETKIIMSKKKKADLIVDILKHTEFVGGSIKVKNVPIMDQDTLNVKVVKEKKKAPKVKVPKVEVPKVEVPKVQAEVKKSYKTKLKYPEEIIDFVKKFDYVTRTGRDNFDALIKFLDIPKKNQYRYEYYFNQIFKGNDEIDEIDSQDEYDEVLKRFNEILVLIKKVGEPPIEVVPEKKIVIISNIIFDYLNKFNDFDGLINSLERDDVFSMKENGTLRLIFEYVKKGKKEINTMFSEGYNNVLDKLLKIIGKKQMPKQPSIPKKKEKKVIPEENYKNLDKKTIDKIEDVKSKLKKLIDGR